MSGRSCERVTSKMTGAPAKRGGAARGYAQKLLRAAQLMGSSFASMTFIILLTGTDLTCNSLLLLKTQWRIGVCSSIRLASTLNAFRQFLLHHFIYQPHRLVHVPQPLNERWVVVEQYLEQPCWIGVGEIILV